MCFEEGPYIGFQFGNRTMSPALYLLPGQLSEPALYLIQPTRGGWREVDLPMWSACQPCFDPRRLVGGVVVHDQMHVPPLGHFPVDLLEEVEEFG